MSLFIFDDEGLLKITVTTNDGDCSVQLDWMKVLIEVMNVPSENAETNRNSADYWNDVVAIFTKYGLPPTMTFRSAKMIRDGLYERLKEFKKKAEPASPPLA